MSCPSIKRLLRQLVFMPMLHNRWLNAAAKDELTQKIAASERGHRGEICLIIENHLPLALAYRQDCTMRARELFGQYGVWDTEDNTGVLIYVNLCEHHLQIVADRGINKKAQDSWQMLCDEAIIKIKNGNMQGAIDELIDKIGELLRLHFGSEDSRGDELPNRPVYLR